MVGIKTRGLDIKKALDKKHLNEKHWYYEIKDLGFKYNMNDLMAVIGIVQLKKLNFFNFKRNEGIKIYLKGIERGVKI